ncbi:hypothetical protein PHJA_001132400 [Phtheirospermum japonicum]|uniref:SHSP domain-containing protein n=1 Tax=Phtheirospermum japonicum TaxID=374723 RepID=A0A830BSW8_9LAMI|nr:hypothetical protein PHJA_001132400 [Phtheirospermum japonicum]
MAGKVHQGAPVYEEFEPFCKWQRKEDRDILEINLPDFKKDQLRVQISNQGILKVSGERGIENSSRKSKFHKEIIVPSNTHDTQAIQAKFVAGWLYITMPIIGNARASSGPSKTLVPTPKAELAKDESSPPKAELAKDESSPPASGGKAPAGFGLQGGVFSLGGGEGKSPEGFELEGVKRSPASRPRLAKVAVSLAATAAAVAVLIAYVVYMFRV